MDYVWICRDGNNEELRYSIRSVIKNMPSGNIWVVGGKPDWYSGKHISVKQNLQKTKNAENNLLTICNSKEISESFVLMNDDFFVVKPVQSVEYYFGGTLEEKILQYQDFQPTSFYTRSLEQTYKRLLRLGISNPLDYELHVPMPMTKEKLAASMKGNSLWRSTYGNLFGVAGKQMKDVKVYASDKFFFKSYDYSSLEYPYISSDDISFNVILKAFLGDMFPDPSVYEKTISTPSGT